MNVKYFHENLELMGHSGFRLTLNEAGLIENSLIILQSQYKFRDIFFFGRIDTSSEIRYYVAFGYRRDIFKDVKYFYSMNAFEWTLLPDIEFEKLSNIVLQSRMLLSGDPMDVESICLHPKFIPDDNDVRLPCFPKIEKIKEEDRLACIVQAILNNSAIVPRGILYRQTADSVVYNHNFRGLTKIEVSDANNFKLFRYPKNNQNYNLAKRNNYNYSMDFLDTLDDLYVKKCFPLSINDQNVCLIRALNWPGMTFFHKLNTPYQGFFYFGNGKRNLDVLFMT